MTYGSDRMDALRRRNQRTMRWRGAAFFLVIVLVLAVGACSAYSYFGSTREVTTKINDKDRVCKSTDSGSDCEYLIFTDAGTFKVADTLFFGNFKSSDVYGKIERGGTYKMRVVGWRVGFWSMYPNVIKVEERLS